MTYFIAFLEGIITFISPCLLPMLPIYISYFTGEDSEGKTFLNSIGFVLGFTLIFVLMGAGSGAVGSLFIEYRTLLNVITGLIVIFFGLNFLGVFKLNIFKGVSSHFNKSPGFFGAFIFGIVFSVGWTPCVGAFLGSALMMASSSGSAVKGIFMLLCYSMGLGIPFVISAVLIDKLKVTFNFIKRNYNIISKIAGGFLVLTGFLMIFGFMNKFMEVII